MKDLKRTTVWLPEDLRQRLAAESKRADKSIAELIRHYLESMTPPLVSSMGESAKLLDRTGFLKVLVLDARDNGLQLLVEPDDFEGRIQIWVDANLVNFPNAKETDIQLPAAMAPPPIESYKSGGNRVNLQGSPDWKPAPPKPEEPEK
jgi:hypothetical protein